MLDGVMSLGTGVRLLILLGVLALAVVNSAI